MITNNIGPRGTLILTFLITKSTPDYFGTKPFAKMFLYFNIHT